MQALSLTFKCFTGVCYHHDHPCTTVREPTAETVSESMTLSRYQGPLSIPPCPICQLCLQSTDVKLWRWGFSSSHPRSTRKQQHYKCDASGLFLHPSSVQTARSGMPAEAGLTSCQLLSGKGILLLYFKLTSNLLFWLRLQKAKHFGSYFHFREL